ncbi:isopenicillin N synthase family dioxygenase [Aspergillus candidus]|uniref:Clavaminate synthase-like protein n=1 Tax=Aspergillus candidus TaxID=41067 RepID=A0A2I2EZ32_ASPCN|nr:Clavaminate synthase-like protein [Aspergillus candidus]PLB33625.1 Clavaminate synthase-like protein [Aspergillus candidus]
MAERFSSIPILEYDDAVSPTSRPRFLSALRHALVNVGFFYLRNPPIEVEVQEALVQKSASFFNLPVAKKQEVAISNSKQFRGYASLASEETGMKSDARETFTVSFDSPAPGPDAPNYHNLIGPNQWPSESTVPSFQQAIDTYMHQIQSLADAFVVLIAEALEINPIVFTRLLEKTRYINFRVAAYPCPKVCGDTEGGVQGVGAHKDGSFLTYLLQGTDHSCLEVQNKAGEWITAPPIANTLVVNIGRSLENLTQGVCVATTHRVILQPRHYCREESDTSAGLRLSFPFFQSLGLDVTREDMQIELPDHILSLRGDKGNSDVNAFLAEVYKGTIGEALLTNYIASHADTALRWYPELQAEILGRQHKAGQPEESKVSERA